MSAALVLSWIERQVERTPDARAVTFADTSLTYRELDERANQLAHHLIAHGAHHDQPIGVALERSLELIVTLLAILKAGAPYLPIDPSYPAPRVDAMREDGGWAVVVDRAWLDAHRAAIEACARTRPGVAVDGDHAAYVIFTSGSTGRPKGAVLTHAGLANRLTWMQATFALGADDAVLHKTPFTFDVSVWELFWPLMTGARLVLARPEGHRDPLYLAETIARERVTTVHFVPSMLGPFLEVARTSPCPQLRRVVCSGEALSPALVREAGEVLTAELHNLYGPTEASIDVSWWRCDPRTDTTTVPIGAPIANTRMYVLDPDGQPAAVGAPGELFLAGVQLARAYSRRPDLTAERFVPDPFHAGERMYRTGDVARVRPDGAFEYLGRVDHQVKLRGYRIELGEIEATIAALPGVRDVVVLAREDRPGDQRLAAYVIAREPARPPTADAIRDHVRAHLPDYMVPSDVIVLDAFPTTANGKLDRAALPAPGPYDEVARIVRAHPDVDDVIVTTRERRLVGYVVPRPEASPTVDGAPRYVLPNQMAVAQLHRYETDFMYEELFVRQAHQRHGIRLRDGMTVVDVGANIGLFGLFCAQACAAPRIFAFEPNPAVRARLEANLAAYAPGARTFACAVGAAPGHARFTVFSGYSLLSGLHPDAATETELVKSYVLNQGRAGAQGADDFARDAEAVLRERFVEQQIDVDIRTLADVIASEHIEHIDLLKIDVEKAEVDVLAGLGPDDWAKIDQIVAEIDLAANVAPIERMLEAHGFDYVIDQDEMLVETELRHVYAIRRGSGLQLDRTADDRAPREVHPVPPRFLSEAALAAWCRTRLPDDAVPEAFVLLEALPRTANGAVDRAALPEPAAWRHAAATETEVERWLSATLRELLDVATLGRDEDFLAASGDSLLGQLAVRIEDTYGVALPRRALFMAPTVRSLGAAIELELRRAEQLLAELDGMSPDELAALLAEGEA